MSNDFYTHTATFSEHTKGKAADLNSKFAGVETAFEKMPAVAALFQGRIAFATSGGVADTYTMTIDYASNEDPGYADGMKIIMKVGAGLTNTGACTVNVNLEGARSIKLINGNDPAAGDLTAGDFIEMIYDNDNTRFVITSVVRSMFS